MRFAAYPFTLGAHRGKKNLKPTASVLWTRLGPGSPPRGWCGRGRRSPSPEEVADERAFRSRSLLGACGARPRGSQRTTWRLPGHHRRGGTSTGSWPAASFGPVGRTASRPPPLPGGRGAHRAPVRFGHGSASTSSRASTERRPPPYWPASNLELVEFVGDYIYEGPSHCRRGARHAGGERGRAGADTHESARAVQDGIAPQRCTRRPWLVTWDDHEVDNNYGAAVGDAEPRLRAPPRPAPTARTNEHMPLRIALTPSRRPALSYPALRTHVGALARFHLLDGRQRRTPQACPPPWPRRGPHESTERSRELTEPGRTKLGPLRALARRRAARSATAAGIFLRRGDAGGAGCDPQLRSTRGPRLLGRPTPRRAIGACPAGHRGQPKNAQQLRFRQRRTARDLRETP
jgi:alkaline phosphatase D